MKKLLRLDSIEAGGRARQEVHDILASRCVVTPRPDLPPSQAEELARQVGLGCMAWHVLFFGSYQSSTGLESRSIHRVSQASQQHLYPIGLCVMLTSLLQAMLLGEIHDQLFQQLESVALIIKHADSGISQHTACIQCVSSVHHHLVILFLQACYVVADKAIELFEEVPNRGKDYIACPKDNGYQSLHCTVKLPPVTVECEGGPSMGPDDAAPEECLLKSGPTCELQIRTQRKSVTDIPLHCAVVHISEQSSP